MSSRIAMAELRSLRLGHLCRLMSQKDRYGRELAEAAGTLILFIGRSCPPANRCLRTCPRACATHVPCRQLTSNMPVGDFIEDKNAILPIDAVIQSNLRETTTRVLAFLTPRAAEPVLRALRHRHDFDHTLEEVGQQFLGDARAHPADRGQGLRKLQQPQLLKK